MKLDKRFFQLICLSGLLALTVFTDATADRVKILYDDVEAFQARVDMIRQAKSEIYIAYFIVRDDTASVSGFGLLLDAANRGVKIKVMLDGLYQSISTPYLKVLTSHPNIEVKVYNRFSIFYLLRAFKRSHEKIIIADNIHNQGLHYITGGRNISDKYFGFSAKRNFDDLDVYVYGESAQTARDDYFTRLWKIESLKPISLGPYSAENLERKVCPQAKKEDDLCSINLARRKAALADARAHIDYRLGLMKAGQVPGVDWQSTEQWHQLASEVGPAQFLFDKPNIKKTESGIAAQLYNIVISDRRIQELTILSPYVILTERGFDLVSRLSDRGIKLTLITNSLNSTDNVLAQAGYANNKQWLLDQGIDIYHYIGPDTIHAKALIINRGESILIGSYNFDPRSAKLNREVGVRFSTVENLDGAVVDSVEKMLARYLSKSNQIGQDGIPIGYNREQPNASFGKRLLMNVLRPVVAIPLVKNNL